MSTKKPYVKPSVIALEVLADTKVSMQDSCKTSLSATGSGFTGCVEGPLDPTPCVNQVS
jgi:hypothetical protein